MPSIIELEFTRYFKRPVEVVRAHFLDMRHHIAHGVHKRVSYTIVEEAAGRCRVRSEIKVMGMKKRDEILLYLRPDGTLVQDFLAGDFAGGNITGRFSDAGPNRTRFDITLSAPVSGVNRLVKPLLRRVLTQITEHTLEEDRVDLEEARYEPTPAMLKAATVRPHQAVPVPA